MTRTMGRRNCWSIVGPLFDDMRLGAEISVGTPALTCDIVTSGLAGKQMSTIPLSKLQIDSPAEKSSRLALRFARSLIKLVHCQFICGWSRLERKRGRMGRLDASMLD